MACHNDIEKQFQRQGLGQYNKLRYRDNITSIADDIMYRIVVLQSLLGTSNIN
jgi:hypothetical protein